MDNSSVMIRDQSEGLGSNVEIKGIMFNDGIGIQSAT
jgi:hypothetical protein